MKKDYLAKIIAKENSGLQTISACCENAQVKIGNIMDNTIEEIWNNSVMRKYQEGQNDINKLKKLDLCNDCIRGGRYYLDENKLTKIVNKEFTNKYSEFFYKKYLDVLDRV